MAFNQNSVARIKNYFLKGVLAIYLIAFTSLYVQVQTLFGDKGIVPLRDYGKLEPHNVISSAPKLGLSYGTFVELLCVLGVLVALGALLVRRLSNALSFGLLWYIYYSISMAGQGFMSFHSDLLLLEVGLITVLLAPLLPTSKISQSDHDYLTFFLIRWLVLRYFVTNVLNIYLDNDKAWYNMTAIPMVAQGVQFPSILSWRVFNLSQETIKLYQAYEHSVKLVAPFLLFFKLKYSRLIAFYTLLFVALPSALFFNFGWTDLLISVCLLSFLLDAYFYDDKRARQSTLRSFVDILVVFAYIGVVVALLVKGFGVKYVNGSLSARVMFTPQQFKALADHLVPATFVAGILELLHSAAITYFTPSRKTSIIKTLLYTVITVALFFSTFPTMTRFSPNLETKVKPLTFTKDLSRFVAPYMLSNNYILLSKVSQHYENGRPELQLQARTSSDDTVWQQFDLRYKPGQPSRELARVIPHIPRVDLKMWYAARSTLQNNQWLQTFAYRVASGDTSAYGALYSTPNNFRASHIRVASMNYKYAPKSNSPFAGYWSQSKFVSEYMPSTSIDNLKFTVKSNGISLTPATKTDSSKVTSIDKLLSKYLEISSDYVRGLDHTAIIWTVSAIAVMSMFR